MVYKIPILTSLRLRKIIRFVLCFRGPHQKSIDLMLPLSSASIVIFMTWSFKLDHKTPDNYANHKRWWTAGGRNTVAYGKAIMIKTEEVNYSSKTSTSWMANQTNSCTSASYIYKYVSYIHAPAVYVSLWLRSVAARLRVMNAPWYSTIAAYDHIHVRCRLVNLVRYWTVRATCVQSVRA